MGGRGHGLEEGGTNPSAPEGEFVAPLDSGADGGPADDAVQPPPDPVPPAPIPAD